MNTDPHIRHLKRQEIDIARWEACVANSANRLIYGSVVYLDLMTDGQWDALVTGDYDAVMPLPWRRKWGISYLYQPAFTQQTGIFSPSGIPTETTDAFLKAAAKHYRFAEIYLNYGNPHPSLRTHENLILPLHDAYPVLQNRYKKDLQRNLRLADAADLKYTADLDLDTAIEAYRSQYADRHPAIRPKDYTRFRTLCQSLQPAETNAPEKSQLILRAAVKDAQLCATALLIRDATRLYLLQSTTPPAGRKLESNHFLIDQLVREFAGTGLTLDFEGSDLPGIAYFYANFGAIRQPYFFHRHNRLPWPWRLLKP
ncbi:MAG TPA: GNAT family N-acetyltransferase [Puia sp.]|jgi:hypothetical protein